MRTGNSDSYPEKMVISDNKKQFRFNIIPFEKEIMGVIHKGFSYEYIELDGEITRSKLIDAIISNVYSKDAELSLINNVILSNYTPINVGETVTLNNTPEYIAYQQLRTNAKIIADELLTLI